MIKYKVIYIEHVNNYNIIDAFYKQYQIETGY